MLIGSDDPTLINDDRFAPAGVLAPKSKADFAFVLHCLSYLSGRGRAEADLEHEFIQDLRNQGYEYLPDLTTPEAMFENARVQLQILNDVKFTDSEWTRFCEEYLDILLFWQQACCSVIRSEAAVRVWHLSTRRFPRCRESALSRW